jgi:hypothetical protein
MNYEPYALNSPGIIGCDCRVASLLAMTEGGSYPYLPINYEPRILHPNNEIVYPKEL